MGSPVNGFVGQRIIWPSSPDGVTSLAGGYSLPPPAFHIARPRSIWASSYPTAASAYLVSSVRLSVVDAGCWRNMSPENSRLSLSSGPA